MNISIERARSFLPSVVGAVAAASEAILKVYHDHNYAITQKADDSPVTDADHLAHQIICQHLELLDPSISVVSEEHTDAHRSEFARKSPKIFWLVDPIDGTKEFINRNGEFTVNIALIDSGQSILGVVGQPTKAAIYSGIVGAGAWLQVGDGVCSSIRTRKPSASPLALISRSHGTGEEDAVRKLLPTTQFMRVGSSLKFCLIAKGEADIYLRNGPTSEWDTAAGQAVLKSAGGHVVTHTGEGLAYGKPNLRNPPILSVGCDQLVGSILGTR